jgi:cytidyltransferase-like protein
MYLKKLNEEYLKILFESIENEFVLDENEILYNNMKLALVPGSFKPPHKGHWEMIMEYAKLADKVFVFISNISTKIISERNLSKSNLQQLAKIINIFETKEQFKVNLKIYNKIEKVFQNIKDILKVYLGIN